MVQVIQISLSKGQILDVWNCFLYQESFKKKYYKKIPFIKIEISPKLYICSITHTIIMTSVELSMEKCPPGSWWVSEDDEILIQVLSADNPLIETPNLINFKYWTGPKTNQVEACSTFEEFVSTWKLKSR